MKNLNFISTNSSLQFITIYLYYIYVIICFFRFSLETFEYSARDKILVQEKTFLKRSKKKFKACRLSDEFSQALSLFRFCAKKNSSKSVLSLRIPMCRKIKHLRRRPVGQGTLSVNLIPTFLIIFSISHTFRQIVWIKWLFC